jgi:toxin ParE1/3/4
MSRNVQFEPEAERELLEAADFYDHERAGLGSEFLDEVDDSIRDIVDAPESYPVVLGLTRKLVLQRFPYLVTYYVREQEIVVTAIAHQRRRPFYWRDRV